MHPAITLSTVTLTLQVAALAVALMIGRAPGWQRVRVIAILAASAGLYSLSSLFGWMAPYSPDVVWAVSNANVAFAGIHVSAWLWFSHADPQGSWRRLPRWLRRAALTNVVVALVVGGSGIAHDIDSFTTIRVGSLGFEFGRVTLTAWGLAAAGLLLAMLLVAFLKQVEAYRRGESGSAWVLLGFGFFLACAVEEALVAAGVIDFIALAELGYLALVSSVTAQFAQRFVNDARRLEVLTEWLSAEVETATHERDDARHALDAQKRFAALGRIAGGIGHEINNPLQILTLNLEELRETHLRGAPPDALEAVGSAVEAADRIGRVVAAVRAYAQPLALANAPVSPRTIVDDAVAEFRARGTAVTPSVSHEPAPDVRGDPERLAQLVAAAMGNAATVLAKRGEFADLRVRTATGAHGEAVIEIADNGPGFPEHVIDRLRDYPTASREAAGASGLGLFVARGVVEAHAGTLELGRSDLGGGLFRIRLPPAGQTTAVASTSTSAPASINAAT